MKKLVWGLLLLGLCGVNEVGAKSYQIDEVKIRAEVNRNGSMDVEETRTYSFDGSFSFAYQTIERQGERKEKYNLSNLEICDEAGCYGRIWNDENLPRRFYLVEKEDEYYIKWFYRASNTTKQFKLKYRVDNAVTIRDDVAELYWQLVGDKWEIGQKNISAEIYWPEGIGDEEIKAWAHGPSSGQVSIPANNLVTYELDNLMAGNFFEARVVVPKRIFSGGVMEPGDLTDIEEEEASFARQTINQQRWTKMAGGGLLIISLVINGLILGVLARRIKKFWQHGKEEALPRVSMSGRIWEAPSNIDPAQVEQLLTATKNLTPKSFTATILRLIQKRIYRLERSDQKVGFIFKDYEYFLTKTEEKSQMSSIEEKVKGFVDGIGRDRIKLKDIAKWCRNHRTTSYNFFKKLPEVVLTKNLKEGYFEAEAHEIVSKDLSILWLILGSFGQGAMGIVWGPISGNLWLILSGGAGMMVGVGGVVLVAIMGSLGEKRSEKGRIETAGWMAFKKHLMEYKKTKNEPIDSIVIWENYLVYGTVLGVSIKTLSQLPVKFDSENEGLMMTYWAGSRGIDSGLTGLVSAVNNISTAANSSYGASGVGSSGGASGGGRGGGGGGGGGAG